MIEQLHMFGVPSTSLEAEFETWWVSYPVKRDKKRARKAFLAKCRHGASLTELTRARDNYLAQARAPFIKYPTTFLNVWEEWLEEDTGASNQEAENATQPHRYITRCPDCGDLGEYCLCGQVLHTRETPSGFAGGMA